jgi:hypothetical protein
MNETEFIDKFSVSFVKALKKVDVFANFKEYAKTLANRIGFATVIVLSIQVYLYFDVKSQVDCLFYNNQLLREELYEVKTVCHKKTEVLYSFLKLNDNLFNDVVLNTNQLRFIKESVESINHILFKEERKQEEEQYENKISALRIIDLVEDAPRTIIDSPTNTSYEMI